MPPKRKTNLGGRAVAYTQDACLQHRNIAAGAAKRSLERPERLQAVNVGLAAIYARLEEAAAPSRQPAQKVKTRRGAKPASTDPPAPFTIVRSTRALAEIPLHQAARDTVHVKTEDDDKRTLTYAQLLETWCKESPQKIAQRQPILPEGLEGDLYLCPGSIDAIKGALGTVCEAIDDVAASSRNASEGHGTRAFVAIRPPGHHCVSGAPAGLGFVNNVVVGAVHAFYKHQYTHIIIFDTDLHHGNGTQQVVQQINEQRMKSKSGEGNSPVIYFGSMHDIKSYPCSEHKPGTTAAALLCRSGEDGQWIENTMMVPWESEAEFWTAYNDRYRRLITQAERFIEATKATPDKVMVLMSCGFSASLHEEPTMSLHGIHVPTSFYAQFAREAAAFADRVAEGRLVSVLEGGYSNRAIISGVMAHMAGLSTEKSGAQEEWWDVEQLSEVEKLSGRPLGRRAKAPMHSGWVGRTKQIASCLNEALEVRGDSVVLEFPPLELASTPAPSTESASKASSSKRAAVTVSPATRAKRARQDATPSHSTDTTLATSGGPSIGTPSTPSSSALASTSQQFVLPNHPTSEQSVPPGPSTSQQSLPSTPCKPAASAQNPPSLLDSDVQHAYTEVSTCLKALLALVGTNAAASSTTSASAPVTHAIRPLRGCVARLERILGDRAALMEALAALEKLLEEAHRVCAPLKGELESVDRAIYDLEGAVFDFKTLCSDS